MLRRRPRKVGLRRQDAAMDAMRELGFEREKVKQALKKLLQVYEGDAGWIFIEEASYKLLIETLLENADEGEKCCSSRRISMLPWTEEYTRLEPEEFIEIVR